MAYIIIKIIIDFFFLIFIIHINILIWIIISVISYIIIYENPW